MLRFGIHSCEYLLRVSMLNGERLVKQMEQNKELAVRTTTTDHSVVVHVSYRRAKYPGLSFVVILPTRRRRYMAYLENESDTTLIGGREVPIDDNGVTIPSGLKSCLVIARVNNKILSGVTDYITPATGDCMKRMIANFDREIGSISSILGSYRDWSPTRIDYCLNIDLRWFDLNHGINVFGEVSDILPMDYIALIRMGRIPWRYSASEKSLDNNLSVYLVNGWVRINIYCKGEQMKLEHPDKWREEMDWVLRVEIQCLRKRTYSLKRDMDNTDDLFDESLAQRMIVSYWKKVVGLSDWYSLCEAKRLVRASGKRIDRIDALEKALTRVSLCHGINGAREKLKGYDLDYFDRSLRELEQLGVNPVTIPVSRGVKHIKNPVRVLLEQTMN